MKILENSALEFLSITARIISDDLSIIFNGKTVENNKFQRTKNNNIYRFSIMDRYIQDYIFNSIIYNSLDMTSLTHYCDDIINKLKNNKVYMLTNKNEFIQIDTESLYIKSYTEGMLEFKGKQTDIETINNIELTNRKRNAKFNIIGANNKVLDLYAFSPSYEEIYSYMYIDTPKRKINNQCSKKNYKREMERKYF